MYKNNYLINDHNKTSMRNCWAPCKCQNRLMFPQGDYPCFEVLQTIQRYHGTNDTIYSHASMCDYHTQKGFRKWKLTENGNFPENDRLHSYLCFIVVRPFLPVVNIELRCCIYVIKTELYVNDWSPTRFYDHTGNGLFTLTNARTIAWTINITKLLWN